MGLGRSVIWMPAILLGPLVIFTAVAGEPTSEDRAAVLSVGSEKQLFIDRLFFDTARDVTLKIHPARKTTEMNVERDRPWESVTLNWFSVLEDGGKYRMWYEYPYAANVYLMFPSLYRHQQQTLDIHLAVSRDGIHWTRPQRVPFIPLGKQGDFDGGALYMGQGLIRTGNELWQYFSGSALGHDEVEFENRNKPGFARVYSRVVSRLDGFVSAEASARGGSFTTPPLTFSGHALTLNVQVRPGGSLRVGLLDEQGAPIQGRSVQDCIPVVGDHTRALVRWNRGGDLSSLVGIATKIRVEMSNTSLYAFQFNAGDE